MFTKENIYATCVDAVKVSVVVGTTLSLINQTNQILNFSFTKQALLRIFLNFLVPFLVASYARYSLLFEQYKNGDEDKKSSNADGAKANYAAGNDTEEAGNKVFVE